MNTPILAADLVAQAEEPVKWLVEGLIPRGSVTLIIGPPKSGKSRFALRLFLESVYSKSSRGFVSHCTGTSVYVSDEPPACLGRRIVQMGLPVSGPRESRAVFTFCSHGDVVPSGYEHLDGLLVIDLAPATPATIALAVQTARKLNETRASVAALFTLPCSGELPANLAASVDTVIYMRGMESSSVAAVVSRWFKSIEIRFSPVACP